MEQSTRVAVITGAAQGIGRRTAEVLAARGCSLAIIDIQSAAATCDAVRSAGASIFEVHADVSNEADVDRAARAIEEHYGRVDVLVNNAGISFIRPAEETGAAEWRRVLDVNLTGPFLLSRAFGIGMLRRREGAIVNVASVAGLAGIGDRAAYNASKHGLVGLTRTLAAEWGGRGVRVNAVCPGWVKTEMDVADQAGGSYSDADIENRVPMGRFARPDDIAQAIAFLADPALSGFVNGETLRVDGGWLGDGSWGEPAPKEKVAPSFIPGTAAGSPVWAAGTSPACQTRRSGAAPHSHRASRAEAAAQSTALAPAATEMAAAPGCAARRRSAYRLFRLRSERRYPAADSRYRIHAATAAPPPTAAPQSETALPDRAPERITPPGCISCTRRRKAVRDRTVPASFGHGSLHPGLFRARRAAVKEPPARRTAQVPTRDAPTPPIFPTAVPHTPQDILESQAVEFQRDRFHG